MKTTKSISLTLLGVLMLTGVVLWGYQYSRGLVLTHLQNAYTWGLYVSGLAFFVGNAAGGLVLSSLIYLFGVHALKPFARIGALAAFANVTAAMIVILPDLGQPMRALNMLLHPQFSSPLIWDVIVLNLYALVSLVYLYILMLPDLRGPFKRLALKVDDPHAFSDRWARRLAPFSLLAAVGIHVVTAWIFATQGSREWWHSAVLAPDFVAAAIASGTAVVLLAALIAYGWQERFAQSYRILSMLIAGAFFVHLFFMYNDYFIQAWYGADESLATLAVMFRSYTAAHVFEVAAPLAGVLILLNRRARSKAGLMLAACALVISGIFVHRFLLMPGAFQKIPLTLTPLGLQDTHWAMPIASGRFVPEADVFVTAYRYFPAWIEILIFTGALAYACFLLVVAIDRLPVLDRRQA